MRRASREKHYNMPRENKEEPRILEASIEIYCGVKPNYGNQMIVTEIQQSGTNENLHDNG